MSAKPTPRRGLPLRETVIVIALIAVLALLALPIVRNTMNTDLARTCQGNLKEWGTVFAMYRTEHQRVYPPPHGYEPFGAAANAAGCANLDDAFDFAPDVRAVFPEYANDPVILACPDAGGTLPPTLAGKMVIRPPRLDPVRFAIADGPCAASGAITRPGADYTYLGFGMHDVNDTDPQISEKQARAAGLPATGPANVVALLEQFQVDEDTSVAKAQSLRSTIVNRGDLMPQLGWPYVPYGGELGQAMLGPLLYIEGSGESPDGMIVIDRSEIIAQYPTTPVMWDAIHQDAQGGPVFTHRGPEGCNVLFMDGHVEFVTYPGSFPMSTSFATMKAVR